MSSRISYFSISSRDRDTTKFPNVNRFTTFLAERYNWVSSIELVQGVIPNTNSVTSEPYLLLGFDEIDGVIDSNDTNIANAFSMLHFGNVSTNWITFDKKIHEQTVKRYVAPKRQLDRVTISIRKYDGTLFDFGLGSDPMEAAYQNTWLFKIVHDDKRLY